MADIDKPSDKRQSAYDERLGRVLQAARKRRGFTPAVVAEAVGVSDEHVRRIEAGRASPDWDLTCRLLVFFNLAHRAGALILGQTVASRLKDVDAIENAA